MQELLLFSGITLMAGARSARRYMVGTTIAGEALMHFAVSARRREGPAIGSHRRRLGRPGLRGFASEQSSRDFHRCEHDIVIIGMTCGRSGREQKLGQG